MNEWTVVCKPIMESEVAGLAVIITYVGNADDGFEDVEVGRIAYVRQQSANPNESFEAQLGVVFEKAERACELVNELADDLDRMNRQADAERQARERDTLKDAKAKIKEAVGSARSKKAKMS